MSDLFSRYIDVFNGLRSELVSRISVLERKATNVAVAASTLYHDAPEVLRDLGLDVSIDIHGNIEIIRSGRKLLRLYGNGIQSYHDGEWADKILEAYRVVHDIIRAQELLKEINETIEKAMDWGQQDIACKLQELAQEIINKLLEG